jgi:hypothetical protein
MRRIILILPMLFLLVSCGKKRDIAPEERGTPTTLPYEQLLYRDARAAFTEWLKVFTGETPIANAYDMLTGASRRRLRDAGASNRKEFEFWFRAQQHNALPPFYYQFSRIDILDTDIRDTTKCIITATMVVDVQSQKIESVSSFTLLRENGAWRIPFAESGDWIRSWWQQERRFTSQLKDDGYTDYSSASLGLTMLFPVSWDLTESGGFKVPNEPQAQRGIEIRYVNPTTQQTEALVRIWAKPHDIPATPDSSQGTLQFVEKYDAAVKDALPTTGRSFVYDDKKNGRLVHIYAGVNPTETTFANYATVFTKMLESLSITQ